MKNLGRLFENVEIEPCLLHGDLWSGNISSDKNGEPVILDPACYCKSKLVGICSIILCPDDLYLEYPNFLLAIKFIHVKLATAWLKVAKLDMIHQHNSTLIHFS